MRPIGNCFHIWNKHIHNLPSSVNFAYKTFLWFFYKNCFYIWLMILTWTNPDVYPAHPELVGGGSVVWGAAPRLPPDVCSVFQNACKLPQILFLIRVSSIILIPLCSLVYHYFTSKRWFISQKLSKTARRIGCLGTGLTSIARQLHQSINPPFNHSQPYTSVNVIHKQPSLRNNLEISQPTNQNQILVYKKYNK